MGCIPDLQLKINMVDDHPIQKCYNSIPKPLYQEVKVCTKSFEPRVDQEISVGSFSSVVCVHQNDPRLQLCVYFCGVISKTIPDPDPLPQIQGLLDSLGGHSWFSILDQSSACHQGFVSEESRYLTAFSTSWGLYEWVCILFGQMHLEHFRDAWKECRMPYWDTVLC